MAAFDVKVAQIYIEQHKNAERLEIGRIGSPDGWQVVVGKGLYRTGDWVAYIGENAVVPEWLLKRYGYWNLEQNKGLLAGSKGDRVKAKKLRDEFSLGIVIPVQQVEGYPPGVGLLWGNDGDNIAVGIGDDVTSFLGVTKYNPPIPVQMAGEVYNGGTHIGVNYDIEDIKKYPDVYEEGEQVQVSVKIHGTLCQIVCLHDYTPSEGEEHKEFFSGDGSNSYIAVGSKGLGSQGLFFKHNEQNINNVYLRTTERYWNTLLETAKVLGPCVTIVGEVFGKNVQDFDYGQLGTSFRFFDVYVGFRGRGRWLDDIDLALFEVASKTPRAPVIYRGPYDKELIDKLTNDPETEFPESGHVREGTVTTPLLERSAPDIGRVKTKSRSIAYLTRKGGTEFN